MEERFLFSTNFIGVVSHAMVGGLSVSLRHSEVSNAGQLAPRQYGCRVLMILWLITTWITRAPILLFYQAGLCISRLFFRLTTWSVDWAPGLSPLYQLTFYPWLLDVGPHYQIAWWVFGLIF